MKLKKTTIILIIVCVVGLSLLLYPPVSNYINEKHSTKAINTYMDKLGAVDYEEYERIWKDAVSYNEKLLERDNPYQLPSELAVNYHKMLKLDESGIMGYVEIPEIDVSLPIYHGTSEAVLQAGIGHVDWTSLPVGGKSTHCVLSGHRALASAKLLTDLDKLREGDLVILYILNEELTYEVDQIRTVLPEDARDLLTEEGEDYCTLLTCTPYGINTHRLLVRGHRIENIVEEAHVVSEAVVIEPLVVAPVLAAPLLLLLLLMVLFKKPESKKKPNPVNNTP